MTVRLLDVNVLVAIAWPQHTHHIAARQWFAAHADRGWSTTPVTESGFVRVSSNPRVISEARTPSEAGDYLSTLRGFGAWSFLTDDVQISTSLQGIVGYRQVTDAHLLQLAARHGGTVVTFDGGLIRLAEQRGQSATVIPV